MHDNRSDQKLLVVTLVHALVIPLFATISYGRDCNDDFFLGISLYFAIAHWWDCLWTPATLIPITVSDLRLGAFLLAWVFLVAAVLVRRVAMLLAVVGCTGFVAMWVEWRLEVFRCHDIDAFDLIVSVITSAPFVASVVSCVVLSRRFPGERSSPCP